jgi:cytosine/adenosine deaminase-related metal-dependent hydrolase
MGNRLLTADRIHDGKGFLPQGAALELTEDGRIVAIHPEGKEGAEQLQGILVPGFVNAHCHLELSHMKGMIPQGSGLIPFLQHVTKERHDFSDEQKKVDRHEAYAELLRNGVVAVGDICNTSDTVELRKLGQLHMHTFVECLGFTEAFAAGRLAYSQEVLSTFKEHKVDTVLLRETVVPHAPYSVSPTLFKLISDAEPGSLLSIHNQESAAENEYYQNKTGGVCDLLHGLGINSDFFEPSGKSSLQTYLPWLDEGHPLILVHNTFSAPDDVELAYARAQAVYWCLCPNANQYIEGRLPDVPTLSQRTDRICIGTDSLASNTQLSVLAELQVLHAAFPEIGWESLLRWGTSNGAAALQMQDVVGSFTPGLAPGVVLLSSLEPDGRIQRIL